MKIPYVSVVSKIVKEIAEYIGESADSGVGRYLPIIKILVIYVYWLFNFSRSCWWIIFCTISSLATAGWISQWKELWEDPEFKITRPRQLYTGHVSRKV